MPRWLVCASFFYPGYWLAMLWVSLPALLSRDSFRVSAGWVGETRLPAPQAAVMVAVGAMAAAWVFRRRPVAAGLLMACLAHVVVRTSLLAAIFAPRARVAHVPLAAGGLLLLVWALWRMGRVALPGFVAPLAIFVACVMPDWRIGGLWVGIAVLAALPALFRSPPSPGPPMAWTWLTAGVAASLVTAGLAWGAGHYLDRERAEKRRQDRVEILASVPRPDPAAPYPRVFFQKGINFTAEGPQGYRPRAAVPMLDHLRRNGVDAIALVPYGFSRDVASTEIRFGAGGGSWEREDDIEALTALAHQRGFRVMLKPQIWLGRGGYPGEVHAEPKAWFSSYRRFAEHYAALAARMHADVFCVGVEFRQMARHAAEWRAIIARVREIYPGPLVYAATQGEEFESITFWDALDYIGLNNYYPLRDDLSTGDIVRKVEAVEQRYHRPVIFPEAGFSSYEAPHRAPWDETPRRLAPDQQARCYEAVLRAFYAKPWFQGVYWWKVGSNGYGGPEDGSHTPWGKPAMEVVSRWYTQGGR